MRTILLTGSTGFIGKRLLEMMQNQFSDSRIVLISSKLVVGHECICHKNFEIEKVEYIKRNINQIDDLILLGAFSPKNRVDENQIFGCCSNITSIIKLLESLPVNPARITYCSTTGVYKQSLSRISETSPVYPENLYALSKYFCEKIVGEYGRQYKSDVRILRFGSIYGPGEDVSSQSLLHFLFQQMIEGEAITIFGDGSDKRAYLYVDDLCTLIMQSIKIDKQPCVINFTSDFSYSIYELISYIEDISGMKAKLVYKSETSSPERLSLFDNKLRKRYFKMSETNIQEGLMATYHYWKENMEEKVCL